MVTEAYHQKYTAITHTERTNTHMLLTNFPHIIPCLKSRPFWDFEQEYCLPVLLILNIIIGPLNIVNQLAFQIQNLKIVSGWVSENLSENWTEI